MSVNTTDSQTKTTSKSQPRQISVLMKVTATALFAAMTTICILLLHIPTGSQGYIHVADGVIYLAAAILPLPYAMLAGSIGGGLADLLSGYPSYIIPTMIIKAVIVLTFSSKSDKLLTKRNLIAPAPALVLTVVLYAIAGFALDLLAGATSQAAFADAVAGMPLNALQGAASAVLFYAVGAGLDKLGFKKKLKF
ncbi:MAG: TIGR04002 family protein [Acutalibacteraceae bacterium]